jgi:urease accessory protein
VRLAGGDALLGSGIGWRGRTVAGVLWAWGTMLPEPVLERCRDRTMARPDAGMTVLGDGLLVVRALSDSAEGVRELFQELWTIIRPAMTKHRATLPRIWAT